MCALAPRVGTDLKGLISSYMTLYSTVMMNTLRLHPTLRPFEQIDTKMLSELTFSYISHPDGQTYRSQ